MSPTRRALTPRVRYRVTVAELIDGVATVVMDATGAGFHAAVGDLDGDRLLAKHGVGGDPHLLEHLAELIADHPTGLDLTRFPGQRPMCLGCSWSV